MGRLARLTGAFGAGIYLTEDATKMDQYTAADSNPDDAKLAGLHDKLFQHGWLEHPGEDLFYCLVVRCTLGWVAQTVDGVKTMDSSGTKIFKGSDKRELSEIPFSAPPVRFDSLIAEKGRAVKRFREFVVFNEGQCYVEYVIAYRRV